MSEHEARSITFTTRLTPGDVMSVAMRLLLRHPVSVMAMAAGPVFLLVGMTGDSGQVTELGRSLVALVVAIPAFAFLVGSFNAYRPGTGELYQPVEWSFAEDGIEIVHPGRRARAEWSEFRSWRTAAGCYLLDLSKTRYLIIRRADVPEQELDGFEALIREHLGAKRR